MTADNITPINPTTEPGTGPDGTPDALTVGDLRRALHERHGAALRDVDARLSALSVARVRSDAADEVTRHANRVADLQGDLVAGYGRLTGSPDDPLKALADELRHLIDLYGVLEVLSGRGARRGSAQGQS